MTKARMKGLKAYQKVHEFDLSSGADWKTTANVLFTVPPKHKEFGKALDDISTFTNCSRVWSVGEDITMIVSSEDGEGGAGSRRHARGERRWRNNRTLDGLVHGGEGADQEGDAFAGRQGRRPGSRRCFRAARG